ncbi:MAG: hypothetical protein MUP74_01205, partial [Desulfobacterales bacterium]|nr:hypothetical protein [Desulfobacterales bacterium]
METKVVRNSIEPNTTPLWVSLLCIISTVVVWTSPASALPAPTSQQVITPYTAIATPVVNAAAAA